MFNLLDASMFESNMTKYPNGKTIFESLSATITSFNDAVTLVNAEVAKNFITIGEAEETLRGELTIIFDNLEAEYLQDFSVLQDQVDAAVLSVADKVTQVQHNEVLAQLADIEQDKAEKADVGLLSGLLTTAKNTIVAAINELFNSKANKAQEAWITPTLLNGATEVAGATPQFYKDSLGIVHMRGMFNVTALNGVVLQFPVGYRPGKDFRTVVSANNQYGMVRVFSTGVLYPAIGALTNITLDDISFRAEG